MTIQVMLVDDHAVVRTGYRRLIDAEPGMHVVADVATADEACAAARDLTIDVVVMDLSLRTGSGLDAIRRVLDRQPNVRVLVFSMHESIGYVNQALKNGASGYITKNSEPSEMIAAIRGISRGERVFSPEISHALVLQAIDGNDVMKILTPREFDVLRLFASGTTLVGIAEQLHLSTKTVMNNISIIRRKLGVESEMELLLLAARHGLVQMPQ